MCHALKYFDRTGRPITPPRSYPGKQMDPVSQTMKKELSMWSAPKPHINIRKNSFTNDQLQTLARLKTAKDTN
jgi:hypothetical protein